MISLNIVILFVGQFRPQGDHHGTVLRDIYAFDVTQQVELLIYHPSNSGLAAPNSY